jgi:hypothetical protein
MTPLEAYIRAAAQQRGINPDIAVTVARHEGGLPIRSVAAKDRHRAARRLASALPRTPTGRSSSM